MDFCCNFIYVDGPVKATKAESYHNLQIILTHPLQAKQEERFGYFTAVGFCHAPEHIGELQGKNVIRLLVTPNSSLSFEASVLKFCKQTSHMNTKKLPRRFLKFCLGAELWGFFYGQTGYMSAGNHSS